MIFKNARPITTVRGADPKKLSEAVQKLASEAESAESSADAGGGVSDVAGSVTGWAGVAGPKGYNSVTDQVQEKGVELLNRDTSKGEGKVLFKSTKPSALQVSGDGKGKGKDNTMSSEIDWVESDTDEQLMLFVPFQSTVKLHSFHITSLPPTTTPDDEDDEDELAMRPRTLRLYINRAHVLGFDEADDIDPVQTVTLEPKDWDPKTGTAKVELRFVKFQKVSSVVIFFVDGDGDKDKIRVDRVRLFGEAGEKRDLGKLEKIGDEPGE